MLDSRHLSSDVINIKVQRSRQGMVARTKLLASRSRLNMAGGLIGLLLNCDDPTNVCMSADYFCACETLWSGLLWRSIQHNNTTPLIRMRFSVTSLLGQWGQICLSEFLKIISSFFAQNFCTDRVDILLCSERKKRGGVGKNLVLWPRRSIVGVGDKHAHDSDHAECFL